MTTKEVTLFQKEILDWYTKHQRNLPWRRVPYDTHLKQRDPYKILVSEVMLQQTQVQRVIPKYEAWLKAFPTLQDLADASTRDVLLHWSGLGYNRRALYLQKLAQTLVNQQPSPRPFHKGRGRINKSSIYWPKTEKELRQLPGIGEYTARALLCFAFDQQVAVVDTNVRKVIWVKFFSERAKRVEEPSTSSGRKESEQVRITNKEIQEIADHLLPPGKAYEWNQALMDYAASMLKEHKIPIPRQSRFRDSDRYFRGQILRRLLDTHAQTEKELMGFFYLKSTPITKDRLQKILMTMEKDKFIVVKKEEILLT